MERLVRNQNGTSKSRVKNCGTNMRIWPQEKKNTGAPTSSFNHAAIKHQKRPPTIDEDPRASSRVNT